MQTREIGRTGVHLSVVGVGTSQLQMLPKRQAIDTLVCAFEQGVNWVHTAPDYGGIDPWIREAIDLSDRKVMVASGSPPHTADIEAFFENTCHVYGTPRLALYGIAGIEDIEWFGEKVWGADGMIGFLQRKKAEGRLGSLFCTTHGSADYVKRLIETGVFDAIMLAWNPLGFHQQSHAGARAKVGRHHEDLVEFKDRIFPLAAQRDVSLLVMRPLAGGMLLKSPAFPPHDWVADSGQPPVAAADVLRMILAMPGVCAVVPGTASVEEALENASAGHQQPLLPSPDTLNRITQLVAARRSTTCSHCGACESTCSRQLPLPAMFRDAAIWTLRSETNQADPSENYFDLHPDPVLACVTCTDQTCLCPQGIDIPKVLGRSHDQMQSLRAEHQHPGPSKELSKRIVEGDYPALVLTADVPQQLAADGVGVARFLLRNLGPQRWLATQHAPDPTIAMGIGITCGDHPMQLIPLRNTICPDEVHVPVVLEFQAPTTPGTYALQFCLMTLASPTAQPAHQTIFHTGSLMVTAASTTTKTTPTTAITTKTGKGLRQWLRQWIGPAAAQPSTPQPATAIEPSKPPSPDDRALPPAYGAQLLEHSIPARLNNGQTYGVRLTIQNTGSFTWYADHPQEPPMRVEVLVDGVLQAALALPDGSVAPDQPTTLHFSFRAPDTAGPHRVRIELVHHGVTRLTDQGVPAWTIDVEVQLKAWSRTVELFEIERNHNPWHYNPFQGITQSRDGHPFPLFIERAKGCIVWDVEGHEYTDYTMGWGSTILGHGDDRIQQAIRESLDCGAVLPLPHPLEMEVSRMLIEDFAPHDMVAFGKNGSDVCSIAARLARVTTKKRVILSCGFHGWQDFALEYFQFEDCGIPFRDQRNLYKFQFNDIDGFLALYDRHKHDLAAVMIEPAGPLIDDLVGLGGEPDPDFLHLIADATRRVGALLVFDEIVTGFRYRHGSVQKALGIVPDLTCLGKALASGMPLSALLGSQRLFLPSFHKTHFHPTFRGEVYSLAAAKAAIQIYRTEPVAEHIWRHGEALRQGIEGACRELGIAGHCSGPAFRMAFIFHEPNTQRRRLKRTLLMQELVKQRVLTVNAMLLPSYAHDDATLHKTIGVFRNALTVVADADRRNTMHQHIELVIS